jgi:hypothetical protein
MADDDQDAATPGTLKDHLRSAVLSRGLEDIMGLIAIKRSADHLGSTNEALRVLELIGEVRRVPEVAEAVAYLAGEGRDADVAAVLESAALCRPAEETAQIAVELRRERCETPQGPAAHRLCALAAAGRSARDVAWVVRGAAEAGCADLAEAVVDQVAAERSADVVARLELALKADGRTDLADRLVSRALAQCGGSTAEFGEMVRYLRAYSRTPHGSDERVLEQIRTALEANEVARLVAQELRQPGHISVAREWCAAFAGCREVGEVVALQRLLIDDGLREPADEITVRMAGRADAKFLLAYAQAAARADIEVCGTLSRTIGAQADGVLLGDVIRLWHEHLPLEVKPLVETLARYASAERLDATAVHLVIFGHKPAAADLLEAALEIEPVHERFTAAQIARLLARLPEVSAWRRRSLSPKIRRDPVFEVVRRLEAVFSTAPDAVVGVDFLAELSREADLACAADKDVPPSRFTHLFGWIGDVVAHGRPPEVAERFRTALLSQGAPDLAERFAARLEP